MDISQPVKFGGITFSPVHAPAGGGGKSGYELRSVSFGDIPVRVSTEPLPLADGLTISDAYFSGRPISCAINVYGTSEADLWDKVATLKKTLSPRNYGPSVWQPNYDGFRDALMFHQPTISSSAYSAIDGYLLGYIPLYWRVKATRQPTHKAVSGIDADSGGHSLEVEAQLLALDPYAYIQGAWISQTMTTAGTGNATGYRGNAFHNKGYIEITKSAGAGPSDLWLKVQSAVIVGDDNGFVGDPYLSTSSPAGVSIHIDLSGQTAAGTYVLSLEKRMVFLSTTPWTPVAGIIKATSIFGSIGPGSYAWWYLVSGSMTYVTSVTLKIPEAFF